MLSATTLLFSALLAAAPAAGGGGAALKSDLDRLQGTWTGKAGPKHQCPVTITITGRHVSVTVVPPVGPEIEAEGELVIDETVVPKALDWVRFHLANGDSLPEIAAIYELDGDTLHIGHGGPNNPRPTEFAPGDGVLADVVIFKRVETVASSEPAR